MKILHVFTLISTPRSFFDGQFKFLAENGYKLSLATDSEIDQEFCRRNDLTYHQIPIARKIDVAADFMSISRLRKLIKVEKYDAVVGHTPKGAMVAMIAAWLAGVKTRVYYRHGLIYTTSNGPKRFILKSVERLTGSLATKIVNVSPSLSELAVKDRLNKANKQSVIGCGTCGGIDTRNLFNPEHLDAEKMMKLREGLGLNGSKLVVGFCGRICKEKGIRELIDGFRLFKIYYAGLNPKLLLVGSYDARDILPQEYKDIIESDENIVYVGRIPKKDLPSYYALMDVFVFPSYREGFGMCVIEAGAMGVPALVSRSHGCVDSIVENVTGRYIDISAEGINEGLYGMLNENTRRRLGKNAREYVVENYDHQVMWPKVAELYKELEG